MATKADEFDPSPDMLRVLVRHVVIPELDRIAAQTSIPYVAKVDVCVQDSVLPKFSLSFNGIGEYETEENTLVRIRFRRTIRTDRCLFGTETQHSKWRQSAFSGIHFRGEIILNGSQITPQLNSMTVCHNSGWRGW